MALADFENSAEFTELEKQVLRYASAMTTAPVEIPEDLFAALQSHFDAPQLVELTAAIAWENYRARFNHAFGCEAEGYSEGAFCPLPTSTSNTPSPRSGP
jgi:alkylhydroperoxidase family enzyme